MAQEHRRKCKSPLFAYCSPISLKFHLIWSNLGDLVYTLRPSAGHKIPYTDRLCALPVHCSAMAELYLSQVSDQAPGDRSTEQSVMRGSMRSPAKWQSCLCSADDADMAHQETDPWAKLLPGPGEETPGPGCESGSSVNHRRNGEKQDF